MKNTVCIIMIVFCLTANAEKPITKKNSIVNNNENMSRIEQYWTDERLKNAIPHPLPTLSNEKFYEMTKSGSRNNTIKGLQSQEGSSFNTINSDVPTIADISQRPFWNGGKLFFTKPNGKNYTCSAQFVGKKNILLTAAHCVRNGETGVFYKNFIFYRGYNNGGGQKVLWNCAVVSNKWANPQLNYKYDFAFINTKSDSGTGWFGWKTNVPYNAWSAIGYPVNYGNGKYMFQIAGTKGTNLHGIVEMLGNPMEHGSSGGAWIAELNNANSGGNYAVGINSFGLSSKPDSEFSPLFGSDFVAFYNQAQNDDCKE